MELLPLSFPRLEAGGCALPGRKVSEPPFAAAVSGLLLFPAPGRLLCPEAAPMPGESFWPLEEEPWDETDFFPGFSGFFAEGAAPSKGNSSLSFLSLLFLLSEEETPATPEV
jgi:hypothetical protein